MKDILPELNGKPYIENLDLDYDIHFCRVDEIDELVEFIDNYWRKDHIFVLSRKLLDWQHYDAVNGRYNFVLAKHRISKEIHSILGFVPTYQFDSEIDNVEVWPCIWKSRDDIQVKGLGVSLYYYMKSHIEIESISILGISEIALSIYKHWNFSTGKIEQYYYPNMKEKEVLSFNRQISSCDKSVNNCNWNIRKISQEEYNNINSSEEIFSRISKYKSKKYYINRYLQHPIYKYDFYVIENNDEIRSIMITRECGNGIGNCLRIVDYIGDEQNLINVRMELQDLMEKRKYEYIDFVVVGISSEILESAGFVNRKNTPETIIPNYFEPFQKENIDLDYAFKTINPEVKALFYKADADQDRPNMI